LQEAANILLLHLSRNDLTKQMGMSQQDLDTRRSLYPCCRVVWSNIIPRKRWQSECEPQWLNRSRRGINRE
ncbi:hypothetical protein JRQ81_001025, partial [Phrynocephalus forsythii]